MITSWQRIPSSRLAWVIICPWSITTHVGSTELEITANREAARKSTIPSIVGLFLIESKTKHIYMFCFTFNSNYIFISHGKILQNGCLHDVRDASLVCESSQFLTAWRLVLSMKPWSYIWLEFGLFSTIIAIIRACACWALFVVALTNTVHLIYIYIYILSSPHIGLRKS